MIDIYPDDVKTISNQCIIRKYSFKLLINRNIFKCRLAFTMANNMASSDVWENIILTKINTYNRWYHWLCEEGFFVPRCEAPTW